MVISAPCFTDKENLPSKSVIVPFVVPFSSTVAPIMGSPSDLEITVPSTCKLCACNTIHTIVNRSVKNNALLSLFIYALI